MAERGYRWDDTDGEALVRSMRSWQPFPDTRPALEQARAGGLRLAILSNTDNDIIAQTLRHLEIPFADGDHGRGLRGVQAVARELSSGCWRRSTWPRSGHSTWPSASSTTSAPPQRLGMRTAWVNRHVEAAPPAPSGPTCLARSLGAGAPGRRARSGDSMTMARDERESRSREVEHSSVVSRSSSPFVPLRPPLYSVTNDSWVR